MKFTRETAFRVIRTFIQAFIATVVADLAYFADAETIDKRYIIVTIVIPAIAAGISAVMNLEEGSENDVDV